VRPQQEPRRGILFSFRTKAHDLPESHLEDNAFCVGPKRPSWSNAGMYSLFAHTLKVRNTNLSMRYIPKPACSPTRFAKIF
jgi:hypothetical protein